jgi:hypothetical protein
MGFLPRQLPMDAANRPALARLAASPYGGRRDRIELALFLLVAASIAVLNLMLLLQLG